MTLPNRSTPLCCGNCRRPLYRKEAICAGRSPVLKGFKQAPVSGLGRRLTVPNGPTPLC